jgi:hypothetical protein
MAKNRKYKIAASIAAKHVARWSFFPVEESDSLRERFRSTTHPRIMVTMPDASL